MAVFKFEGRTPVINEGSYIFPGATVIGDVHIGREVWVGPGAVIRADYGTIEIGDFTAVEDNVVIHARPGETTRIGKHVTLGHSCIIHTGRISDWCVIGMGSIVSDFAEVGEWAAVGEGAVVRSKQIIPPKKIAVGVPAKEVGEVSDSYISLWTEYKNNYNTFCSRYRKSLKSEDQIDQQE
ncbi:MAG: gamma carbonic anhydrase family protein [Candidatus Thermoplasmatota archaeon]|jgi:carbonic anhydrase/acetyltransferase-like protein (isoleucine patch superfamily)|nr:gamma carbonic anhydrase family protein [Candidatus Thermoplasmatota archaeon]